MLDSSPHFSFLSYTIALTKLLGRYEHSLHHPLVAPWEIHLPGQQNQHLGFSVYPCEAGPAPLSPLLGICTPSMGEEQAIIRSSTQLQDTWVGITALGIFPRISTTLCSLFYPSGMIQKMLWLPRCLFQDWLVRSNRCQSI